MHLKISTMEYIIVDHVIWARFLKNEPNLIVQSNIIIIIIKHCKYPGDTILSRGSTKLCAAMSFFIG
jgi:hypothetical protein